MISELHFEKLKTGLTEISVSDLIGKIVNADDVANCFGILSIAYGKNFASELKDKINLLFGMCREEKWSGKRFEETTRWIIRNRPYRDWAIADFLTAPCRMLFTHSKYLSGVHEKGKSFNTEIQWYDINGLNLWAYKKDGELPFPKVENHKSESQQKQDISEPMPDEVRKTFEHLRAQPIHENKLRSLDELIPQ